MLMVSKVVLLAVAGLFVWAGIEMSVATAVPPLVTLGEYNKAGAVGILLGCTVLLATLNLIGKEG